MRYQQKILLEEVFRMTFLPSTHTIYTLLPTEIVRRPFREKTPRQVFNNTHTHLLERESYSSLVKTILVSSPSFSHCHTLRGDLYPNITHTYLECRMCFGAQEVLGIYQRKPVRLDRHNRGYCGIRKAKKDKVPRSFVGVGAQRAQEHWVDQAWRVSCYSCISTYCLVDRFTAWRFFAEFFGFLFDNTSACYLMFASLFPYSCALLLLFVVHVYVLEQYQLIVLHLLLFQQLDKLK